MELQQILSRLVKQAVSSQFSVELPTVEFQPTRKDFEGDITVMVFPMLRHVKGNPEQIGEQIGKHLEREADAVSGFNVIKGFLNLVIDDSYYLDFFNGMKDDSDFGRISVGKKDDSDTEIASRTEKDAIQVGKDAKKTENDVTKIKVDAATVGTEVEKRVAPGGSETDAVMVEYSSPNTNKPLHLGHIRNNLLGYSVAEILKASGHKVYKTQIINDRGIHICKSMLAWQRFGNGETPKSSGLKGDQLVGKYYVAFDKAYKKQVAQKVAGGIDPNVAEKEAPILLEAQEMLQKWEAGDEEVVSLWKTMNSWVYEGFATTYHNLGVDFDTLYYESDTYLLGKDVVAEGIKKGVFFRKEDASVWIDLTDEGLDEKIVLRSDGTAVYMTQDIGTAIQRVKDYPDVGGMVYTVGNEQDYHFKVLFLILKKLGFQWAENLYHLSYGMVDLPSGKMKSREGTVVDADELMEDMTRTAAEISEELGKLEGYSEAEKQSLYRMIGLGALKYYILKVDPKKRILFNPEESVDFQGNTGPFIQYTYARIQSILRKADENEAQTSAGSEVAEMDSSTKSGMGTAENVRSSASAPLDTGAVTNVRSSAVETSLRLHPKEKELIKQLESYPETIRSAAENFSPALIANYTYDLVKEFNSFYQQVSILGEEDQAKKRFRVQLSKKVGEVIQSAFGLLGIEVPERM